MFDILLIISLVCLGYQLGKFVTILKISDEIVQSILKDKPDAENKEVHKLRVEKVGSILYLYDDENNFICQANTLDELAKLSKQYKNIDYAAVIHNDKIFTFVKGVSSEA
jgi:sulfur relay (sulfurtransferase) DsrF/TusC family protein